MVEGSGFTRPTCQLGAMKTLIQVLDIRDPDTSILFLRNPLQYKLGTMYGGTVHSSMFLRAFLRTKQPPGLPSFIATTYMPLITKYLADSARNQLSGFPAEELRREWGSSGACHQPWPGDNGIKLQTFCSNLCQSFLEAHG